MTEFPGQGKFTLNDLPESISDGKYSISLNGFPVTLFVAGGQRYLSMADAATLVDYSEVGYRRRILKLEHDNQKKLRTHFGGREVYMRLEDIIDIFFTPRAME